MRGSVSVGCGVVRIKSGVGAGMTYKWLMESGKSYFSVCGGC